MEYWTLERAKRVAARAASPYTLEDYPTVEGVAMGRSARRTVGLTKAQRILFGAE